MLRRKYGFTLDNDDAQICLEVVNLTRGRITRRNWDELWRWAASKYSLQFVVDACLSCIARDGEFSKRAAQTSKLF